MDHRLTSWHGNAFRISDPFHYSDGIMGEMASQITSIKIVYSAVYSGRKHKSSASQAFVRGIHLWPVNSPHKGPVTGKTFPLDDVIMLRRIPSQRPSNAELWFFSLLLVRTSCWTSSRVVGDLLRRHDTHLTLLYMSVYITLNSTRHMYKVQNA